MVDNVTTGKIGKFHTVKNTHINCTYAQIRVYINIINTHNI